MDTPRRPYHHGDLRSALLRVGEQALEVGGVQNLSLRELSRELGVSSTAPRRHFADKQALLNALAQEGYERLAAALAHAVADRELAFDVRISQLSRAYIGFAIKHAALLELMFSVKHRDDAPEKVLEASERVLAIGPLTIVEGQASGAVVEGDPKQLAAVIFAALQGMVALSSNGKFKGVPLEDIVDEIVERIILGLRPRL